LLLEEKKLLLKEKKLLLKRSSMHACRLSVRGQCACPIQLPVCCSLPSLRN